MVSKVCKSCAVSKPLAEFYAHSGRWRRGACKQCCTAATLAKRDTAAHNASNAKWREGSVEWRKKQRALNRFLLDCSKARPCEDCGNSFPAVAMDWDHRPEETKTRTLSTMSLYKPSSMFKEMSKCDLVCSNCHRVRTSNRITEVCRGK